MLLPMRSVHRSCLLHSVALSAIFCGVSLCQQNAPVTDATPPYKNPNLGIEDRVADLLSRMTLEEKVAQITGGGHNQIEVIDPTGTFTTESARAMMDRWDDPDLDMTPRKSAILRNGVQRYLKEKTRLGIPQ